MVLNLKILFNKKDFEKIDAPGKNARSKVAKGGRSELVTRLKTYISLVFFKNSLFKYN